MTPAAAVPDVEGTPTPEEVGDTLNQLLASLRAAGLLETGVTRVGEHDTEIEIERDVE